MPSLFNNNIHDVKKRKNITKPNIKRYFFRILTFQVPIGEMHKFIPDQLFTTED